ncbi:chromosome partitioning protein [Oleiphilus messinensis]|uniref:Probable chromosome-partitioning protein ParB n=2 Tax=Oleiphilus messinensis TaxID=141451 RepID=A0A1Y0IJR7_9GAMM|nr:chromosome partitioning protein [Oleiphilus messinensis]
MSNGSPMVKKTKGLGGKGLGALLKNSQASISEEKSIQDKELRDLPVELIQRGQYQPRRDMDPTALEELAESIKQQGVMQPIVVRPITEGRYEIVAGERRWRATQLAGMDKIPAIIREINDEAAIAMALIENIQRENLNPIEEAMALQRLQNEFGLTQQQVAEAVGKSRTTITNLLRLIGLHPEVRIMLEHGDIEMGHGKALLGLSEAEQLAAAKVVIARSLSVRQTEALVRKLQQKKEEVKTPVVVDPDITRLERDLAERIGAQVAISHGTQGKGKVVIQYNSLDELDGILAHIK